MTPEDSVHLPIVVRGEEGIGGREVVREGGVSQVRGGAVEDTGAAM